MMQNPQEHELDHNQLLFPQLDNNSEERERLIQLQSLIRRGWKGIDVVKTGIPGNCNIVNQKHNKIEKSIAQQQEEDKEDLMMEMAIKIKELEELKDIRLAQKRVANNEVMKIERSHGFLVDPSTNGNSSYILNKIDKNKQGVFHNNLAGSIEGLPMSYCDPNSDFNPGIGEIKYCQKLAKEPYKFLVLKTITKDQILEGPPPLMGYGQNKQCNTPNDLRYKILRGDTKLVRSLLEANSFQYTDGHEWNILWSSSTCKGYLYEGLHEFQKINHFPQSYEITRKDRLCLNIGNLQEKHSIDQFDFLPETFVLPDQYSDFVQRFQKYKHLIQTDDQCTQKQNLWIVKPNNLSRGRGIYIIDNIQEVNIDDASIVSKYIENPLLINGHKFDLRIYVCITSYEPLRIYIYKEGLVRFASEKYSLQDAKTNMFNHLTNYSINKKNQNFVQNEDLENDDVGFKWSLTAFMKHLETIKGLDINLLWSRIYDLIIKSIISGENFVFNSVKKTNLHRTNCFEVFGYDVLIDSNLKPWLMEINLSPSLACDSPLDLEIKSNLINDTFNLIGIKRYDRKKENESKVKNRMKTYNKGKDLNKQFNQIIGNRDHSGLSNIFSTSSIRKSTVSGQQIADMYKDDFSQPQNQGLIEQIHILIEQQPEFLSKEKFLKRLASIKYKEILREVLAESKRRGNFIRIYPHHGSDVYDKYFAQPRPLNRYIFKMLFTPYIGIDDQIYEEQKISIDDQTNRSSSKFEKFVCRYQVKIPKDLIKKHQQNSQNQRNNDRLNNQSSGCQMQYSIDSEITKSFSPEIPASKFYNNALMNSIQKTLSGCSTDREIIPHVSASLRNSCLTKSSEGFEEARTPDEKRGQKTSGESKGRRKKINIRTLDMVIIYLERVIEVLKKLGENNLTKLQKEQINNFIIHPSWTKRDQSVLVSSGQVSKEYIWTRIHNRTLELKDKRKKNMRPKYKYQGITPQEIEKSIRNDIKNKNKVVESFNDQYLEDLLIQNCKSSYTVLAQILIPKQSKEPQRNTKNYGILMDLITTFEKFEKQNKLNIEVNDCMNDKEIDIKEASQKLNSQNVKKKKADGALQNILMNKKSKASNQIDNSRVKSAVPRSLLGANFGGAFESLDRKSLGNNLSSNNLKKTLGVENKQNVQARSFTNSKIENDTFKANKKSIKDKYGSKPSILGTYMGQPQPEPISFYINPLSVQNDQGTYGNLQNMVTNQRSYNNVATNHESYENKNVSSYKVSTNPPSTAGNFAHTTRNDFQKPPINFSAGQFSNNTSGINLNQSDYEKLDTLKLHNDRNQRNDATNFTNNNHGSFDQNKQFWNQRKSEKSKQIRIQSAKCPSSSNYNSRDNYNSKKKLSEFRVTQRDGGIIFNPANYDMNQSQTSQNNIQLTGTNMMIHEQQMPIQRINSSKQSMFKASQSVRPSKPPISQNKQQNQIPLIAAVGGQIQNSAVVNSKKQALINNIQPQSTVSFMNQRQHSMGHFENQYIDKTNLKPFTNFRKIQYHNEKKDSLKCYQQKQYNNLKKQQIKKNISASQLRQQNNGISNLQPNSASIRNDPQAQKSQIIDQDYQQVVNSLNNIFCPNIGSRVSQNKPKIPEPTRVQKHHLYK